MGTLLSMMTAVSVLVMVVLAVARATRFVTLDKLAEPFRLWCVRRWGRDSLRAYGWFCPWCVAVWLAAPAAAAVYWGGSLDDLVHASPWLVVPSLWLAIAYVAGRIVTSEGDD